jgi:hypothetical protein
LRNSSIKISVFNMTFVYSLAVLNNLNQLVLYKEMDVVLVICAFMSHLLPYVYAELVVLVIFILSH